MAFLDEVLPEVPIVVDLAVKGDLNAAIFVAQRLCTAAQVDNAEPAMAQPDHSGVKVAVSVRTAVRYQITHRLEHGGINEASIGQISGDSAHTLCAFLPDFLILHVGGDGAIIGAKRSVHWFKQPLCVALQQCGDSFAQLGARLPETVHNFAQDSLIHTEYLRQTVLANA